MPGRSLPTGGTPVPDFVGAVAGDERTEPLPRGAIDEVASTYWLDFLFEFCWPDCHRDAHWRDSNNPGIGSGIWTAGRPFHVRHGFISNGEESLADGFDVVIGGVLYRSRPGIKLVCVVGQRAVLQQRLSGGSTVAVRSRRAVC
jgi:hypothetical protein